MSVENERDEMLRSLEEIRVCAKKLQSDAIALHQTVRFDHRTPGARTRAMAIQGELENLGAALHRFLEASEEEA